MVKNQELLIDRDLMQDLQKEFSINEYEVKLWTALLSRGVSTAGELSDIGNVPRSRAYDVLETLAKKGFVIKKVGKPLKFVAIAPSNVIERLKRQVVKESESSINKLEGLKKSKVIKELNLLHTQGVETINPSEVSLAITGQKNILDHLSEQIMSAKSSVNLFTSSTGLIKKSEELKKALKVAKQNNVKVRIAAPINKSCEDAVASLSKYAEVKDSKDFNARFSVIDGKAITYMVLDNDQVHPKNDIGIHSNSPYFAKAMDKMFTQNFKGMKTAKAALK
ncbi:TrmB family transcriptional regulator [Candidatus Woesearchaeota archaeon]|nr:TrmB family transcriptional regulator [Candidatus Woesearchaeota archaeon]MBT4387305.1 TrmB family transcriptional regulator [Candidatus Woesearchaeota archaeon]MBT4595444.1 TrmB family transcriptional regulator [Candidatus Woesearchaeota archaeon]MBT5741159.1 TrmB family transcriptional regulator [Candidatus Woesearchaeota archaeon]MBT6505925.1 TrmB family transcriptional regulator [Candidatus Woesearchaeota archaeon]